MRSQIFAAAALAGMVITAIAPPVRAQSPEPTAMRAAELATQKARQVLFKIRTAGGTYSTGTATLQPIGRTRTRITLRIPPGPSDYSARLYPGSECNDQRNMAATLTLAPLNSAGANAPVSHTIVNLPLEKLSSHYLVDVRKAAQRQAATEACAHL
jgi:hypothetical protein